MYVQPIWKAAGKVVGTEQFDKARKNSFCYEPKRKERR